MTLFHLCLRAFLCALFFALSLAAPAATSTQSFSLQPGWNAIHLEVEPANQDPAVVFSGIPIEQVWSYFPTRTPLQFITNPSDGLWNVAGWNVYLPPSFPDAAVLTDLFAIQAGQTYLVKVTGTAVVTLTITGETAYRSVNWKPDSFTLTGLPIDPTTSVRSGDYFFNSTAHKGQLRYRLDPNGVWSALNDSSLVASGRGYWIFTKGDSDFTAPLSVAFGNTSRMDFGPTVSSKTFSVTNSSASPMTVSISNPSNYPLVTSSLDVNGTTVWTALTTLTPTIPAGGTFTVEVGVRRALLPATSDTLLTVTGQGVRRFVPVSAENPAPGGSNAGLWIGTVTLNAVSQPHAALNPQATAPTPAEFSFRILLHVSSSGAVKLLKEAILMKQVNPPGAGALVLLSNPALIPQFAAPANQDGSPFAYRISSVGYDFSGGPDLALSGAFGGTITGTIPVLRSDPTNPFKHRYHPDHDDLTANYQTPVGVPDYAREVPELSRAIQITFAPVAGGDLSPENGASVRTGTYRESVTGLHKAALVTAGTFTLRRMNTLGEINPVPTP